MQILTARRFRQLAGAGVVVTAMFLTLLPQVAQGFTDASTGKLFETHLTSTPGSPCSNSSASLTFTISNRSTQTSIKFGSANVNLPETIVVSGTVAVTTSVASKASGWTATVVTLSGGKQQIQFRNSGGSPKQQIAVGESLAGTFTASIGSVASQKTFVWGQDSTPSAALDNTTVYVKQSNSFSGTGNDLVPKAGGSKATITVRNCVDLQVTTSHQPSQVTVNENVLYTVTASHTATSTGTANDVVLTVTPYGTPTFVTNPAGCTWDTTKITCNAASLASPTTLSVQYYVRAPGTIGTMAQTASVTSTEEPYNGSLCSEVTDGAPNNCDYYAVTVEPGSDSSSFGYLCDAVVDPTCDNNVSITGSGGNLSSSFTLNSGAGVFNFTAADCSTGECVGSAVTIVPNCATACRGLQITEFATVLGRTAENMDAWRNYYDGSCAVDGGVNSPECWAERDYDGGGDPLYARSWIYVDKDGDGGAAPYPIPFCNSAAGDPYQPYDPQNASGPNGGWETSTTMPFPCLWKYQQVGPPGSNKLQVQIVINKDDPTTTLRK